MTIIETLRKSSKTPFRRVPSLRPVSTPDTDPRIANGRR